MKKTFSEPVVRALDFQSMDIITSSGESPVNPPTPGRDPSMNVADGNLVIGGVGQGDISTVF